MISRFFPWESHNLLIEPWKLQLTLLAGALVGSILTWVRWKKKGDSSD